MKNLFIILQCLVGAERQCIYASPNDTMRELYAEKSKSDRKLISPYTETKDKI